MLAYTILIIIALVLVVYGLWLFFTKRKIKSGYYYNDPGVFFLAAITNAMLGHETPWQHEPTSWERKGFAIFFIAVGVGIIVIVAKLQLNIV